MDSDFSEQGQRNLADLCNLCIKNNIQPCQPNEGELGDILEQNIKNVVFEYGYLNEKVLKRNNKLKTVLHPELQRKQILCGVMKSLWESHLKNQKQSMDQVSKKIQAETKKLNDVERAKQKDQEIKNNQDQIQQIKDLNLTLMEQKTHEIKYIELQNKQMKQQINDDFSALPADLGVAKKRLWEL